MNYINYGSCSAIFPEDYYSEEEIRTELARRFWQRVNEDKARQVILVDSRIKSLQEKYAALGLSTGITKKGGKKSNG